MPETLGCKGLYTNPNEYSDQPEGALLEADNIVLRAAGIAEPRRGLRLQSATGLSSQVVSGFTWKGEKHVCTAAGDNYHQSSPSAWSSYSTAGFGYGTSSGYAATAEANLNLYGLTSTAVYRFTTVGTAPVVAGMPKGLDAQPTLTGTSGFAAGTTRYAYRVVWGTRDANKNVVTGAPSGRILISNPGTSITAAIGAVVRASNVVTVTTTTAHRFVAGQYVDMGTSETNLTAGQKQIATVPSTTTFTINESGSNVTSTVTHAFSPSTCNFQLVITVPASITTGQFFQVYRSAAAASDTSEPDDELRLAYEGVWTSGTTVTITDTITDAVRGAALYTNASQEGILQANDRPPACTDIAYWKGCLWFANLATTPRLVLNLLSVSGANGLAANDTVVIDGVTFTAKTSETIASGFFQLFTDGTVSQNIAATALSLIRVINRYTSNTTVYAYYGSGPDDLPGIIILEARSGSTDFAVTASAHGSAWSPALPTSGTTVASTHDTFGNGLAYSKPLEPEHVPLLNTFRAGSGYNDIIRVIPLRDSMFLFKSDGVYRVTGDDPSNFRVDAFDTTVVLDGAGTPAKMGNAIYAYTNQGVVRLTDGGVEIISRPIENLVPPSFNFVGLDALSGCGYESEHLYLLLMVNPSTGYGSTVYCYSALAAQEGGSGWSRWVIPTNSYCLFMDTANDVLCIGDAASDQIRVEKKDRANTDYGDVLSTATVTVGGTTAITVSVSPSAPDIQAGDFFFQDATTYGVVIDYDSDTGEVTLDGAATLTGGSKSFMTPTPCVVQWSKRVGEDPGVMKQVSEATVITRAADFNSCALGFYTDLSTSLEEITVAGSGLTAWTATAAWSASTFAGLFRPKNLRTYVPLEKQRCGLIYVRAAISVARGMFQIEGLSLRVKGASPRVTR